MSTRQKKQLRVVAPLRRKIDTAPVQSEKKVREEVKKGGSLKRKGSTRDKGVSDSIAAAMDGSGDRMEEEGRVTKRRRKKQN